MIFKDWHIFLCVLPGHTLVASLDTKAATSAPCRCGQICWPLSISSVTPKLLCIRSFASKPPRRPACEPDGTTPLAASLLRNCHAFFRTIGEKRWSQVPRGDPPAAVSGIVFSMRDAKGFGYTGLNPSALGHPFI